MKMMVTLAVMVMVRLVGSELIGVSHHQRSSATNMFVSSPHSTASTNTSQYMLLHTYFTLHSACNAIFCNEIQYNAWYLSHFTYFTNTQSMAELRIAQGSVVPGSDMYPRVLDYLIF